MGEVVLEEKVQVKEHNISFYIHRPVPARCDHARGHYNQRILFCLEFVNAGQEICPAILEKDNPVVGPSVRRYRSFRVAKNMLDPLNLIVESMGKSRVEINHMLISVPPNGSSEFLKKNFVLWSQVVHLYKVQNSLYNYIRDESIP